MTETLKIYPAPGTRELKDTLLAATRVTGRAVSLPATLDRSIVRGRRRRRVAWLILLLLTLNLTQASLLLRLLDRKPLVVYLPFSSEEKDSWITKSGKP